MLYAFYYATVENKIYIGSSELNAL